MPLLPKLNIWSNCLLFSADSAGGPIRNHCYHQILTMIVTILKLYVSISPHTIPPLTIVHQCLYVTITVHTITTSTTCWGRGRGVALTPEVMLISAVALCQNQAFSKGQLGSKILGVS